MKRYLIGVAALLLLATLALPQAAQAAEDAQWAFDMAHSSIFFDIRHIFATVRGQFNEFTGTFVFDPQDLARSRIDITVQVKSIDTRIPKRDNHLRSVDFFGASGYRAMSFKSSAIEHLEGSQYRVTGDLTIKDVTRRITVPFTFHGIKRNPLQLGKEVAGFDARFTIEPLTYHVGDPKYVDMGVIGKEADIFISLEMLRDR
jgi:polyisoprenoid-binding protein YceI